MDFLARAVEVQRAVKYDELKHLDNGLDQYSREQVSQATVHTRQDLVLVVSLLTDLNRQARSLKWIAFVILLALVLLLTKLW
jgi:hypothetical protein